MKVIQELVTYFERRGKLSSAQIDKLLRKGYLATDAPQTMKDLCERVGETFYFRVQGEDNGPVWGTDVYTGDSAIAAASVHAGAVELGESAVIRVTVLAPLRAYTGSRSNGVTSNSFGPYGTAYRVERV
jgi:LCCL domain